MSSALTASFVVGAMLVLLATGVSPAGAADLLHDASYGERLMSSDAGVDLWWAESGRKIGRARPLPERTGRAIRIQLAGNEAEGAQLVVRPTRALSGLTATIGQLRTTKGDVLPKTAVDVLRVRYVRVDQASDAMGGVGEWPDPLPPFRGGIDVPAETNQPLWIRVTAPKRTKPGLYSGTVTLTAVGYRARVPIEVEVFGFSLPDETSCRSTLGLNADRVMQYHRVRTDSDRRAVFDSYLRSFAAHRISPYSPAALDPFTYRWESASPWDGGRLVAGDAHAGEQCLQVTDDSISASIQVRSEEPLAFSGKALRLSLWYRTRQAEQPAELILMYLDRDKAHIAYHNRHIALPGSTAWTRFELEVDGVPAGAAYVQPVLEGAPWTEGGEKQGAARFDDVSLVDTATGVELVRDGGFEAARPPSTQRKLTFDWVAWDAAMERAVGSYHFNSFLFPIPGLGSGSFHSRSEGELLGYRQGTPEHRALFAEWCRQAEAHLRAKGLIGKAICYPFDEPAEKDYDFVLGQLQLLKENIPGVHRLVPMNLGAAARFVGSIDYWCPILNSHDPDFARQRRQAGDTYCWYICCGPTAPYVTEFIDHAATAPRVWLWQTWQNGVDGVLIWETTWWTSGAAYPDSMQNPYEDSMSWVDGYGTPRGQKSPWKAGDGRFIYPPEACFDGGTAPVLDPPVSSIRWEALRDGMEDFEYLTMLKRLIAQKHKQLSAQDLARYEGLLTVPPDISTSLTDWTKDPRPIEARRIQIARAIEELTGR